MATKLPGFTAEASLYKSPRAYVARAAVATAPGGVTPQHSNRLALDDNNWGWDCSYVCAICRYYPGWCFPCWICLIWDDIFGAGTIGRNQIQP